MAANLEGSANKRKLRQFARVAYERELGAELSTLEAEFAKWRHGEIDPFVLSDRLHRFHDGASRDLYVLYNRLPPSQSVARAVALQILQEREVPSELLEALERSVRFYREQLSGPTEPAESDEN